MASKSRFLAVLALTALAGLGVLATYAILSHWPKQTPPAAKAPAKPLAAAPETTPLLGEPVTRRVLALIPETAQVAVAFPSLQDATSKMLDLDRAVGVPFFEEQLSLVTQQLAQLLGAKPEVPLAQIVADKGFDPAGPVALFLNTDKTIDSLGKAAAAKIRASFQPPGDAKTPATDMPDAQALDDPPDPDPPASDVPSFRETLQLPEFAVVLPVADTPKVRQWIEETLGGLLTLSGGGQPVAEGENAVRTLFGYGYFFTENQLVAGHADLVKKVAEQAAHPVDIRYGTPACPPSAENEVAALVYPGRIIPRLRQSVESLTQADPVMTIASQKQVALLDRWVEGAKDDPMVATLAWGGDGLSLRVRLDTEAWPAFLALAGPPNTLELPNYLPGNTSSMVALSLSGELKNAFREQMLALSEGIPTADMALTAEAAPRVLDMMGREAVLSADSPEGDIPAIVLMAALANPEEAKPLLGILLTAAPRDTYRDVEIGVVSSNSLIPLYMAYMGPNVLFSTSVDKMKEVIDRYTNRETSAFLDSLTPPWDPQLERYAGLVFHPSLLDTFAGISGFLGMDALYDKPAVRRMAVVVREFRADADLRPPWAELRMSLQFQPPR